MSDLSTAISLPAGGTYNVGDIARMLQASTRHVRRLADSGAMPRPVHLGRLVRWRRADVDAWLAAGCRRVGPNAMKGGAL